MENKAPQRKSRWGMCFQIRGEETSLTPQQTGSSATALEPHSALIFLSCAQQSAFYSCSNQIATLQPCSNSSKTRHCCGQLVVCCRWACAKSASFMPKSTTHSGRPNGATALLRSISRLVTSKACHFADKSHSFTVHY
jgi:hypothetical protein